MDYLKFIIIYLNWIILVNKCKVNSKKVIKLNYYYNNKEQNHNNTVWNKKNNNHIKWFYR